MILTRVPSKHTSNHLIHNLILLRDSIITYENRLTYLYRVRRSPNNVAHLSAKEAYYKDLEFIFLTIAPPFVD